MNNEKAYIKIGEDEIETEPTRGDLALDNYVDMEYDTPYTDNYDDIYSGIGEVIETGSIFDGR